MPIKQRLYLKTTLLITLLSLSLNNLFATENEIIKVPVRAYYIFHKDLGKVSVTRDQKSLASLLADANTIWRQAGIEFYFQEQGFYQPKDLGRYEYNMEREREYSAINSICPRTKNGLNGIDFCIIGQRQSNKDIFGSDFRVKNKINGRYQLPPLGRKDSRPPRVVIPIKSKNNYSPNAIGLARALGEALRLTRHKGKTENVRLMAKIPNAIFFGNNYTSIILTPDEITKARENAMKIAQ